MRHFLINDDELSLSGKFTDVYGFSSCFSLWSLTLMITLWGRSYHCPHVSDEGAVTLERSSQRPRSVTRREQRVDLNTQLKSRDHSLNLSLCCPLVGHFPHTQEGPENFQPGEGPRRQMSVSRVRGISREMSSWLSLGQIKLLHKTKSWAW